MPASLRTLLVVAQPTGAGVPRHVADLLPGVLGAGWRVEVMCPRESPLRALAAEMALPVHPMADARAPRPGDVSAISRLVPLVRRVDVVHAHSSKAGALVRAAAVLARRSSRVVFTPHGWSFWAYPRAASLERLQARAGGIIIAVSAGERDAGLARGIGDPSQYRVVRNGVDLDRFAFAPPVREDRLMMVSRLVPQRRPALAVEALASLRERRPGATLEFVGDGPLRGGVEARVAELGLRDAVIFAGARDDVPARLAAAACVVHPTNYEGASLAVLEAMAVGRGVVTSPVPGMDELVDEGVTGHLCGDDPADWAAAIDDVLARRTEVGRAARRRVEHGFDVKGMVSSTLAVYDEVAAKRG